MRLPARYWERVSWLTVCSGRGKIQSALPGWRRGSHATRTAKQFSKQTLKQRLPQSSELIRLTGSHSDSSNMRSVACWVSTVFQAEVQTPPASSFLIWKFPWVHPFSTLQLFPILLSSSWTRPKILNGWDGLDASPMSCAKRSHQCDSTKGVQCVGGDELKQGWWP